MVVLAISYNIHGRRVSELSPWKRTLPLGVYGAGEGYACKKDGGNNGRMTSSSTNQTNSKTMHAKRTAEKIRETMLKVCTPLSKVLVLALCSRITVFYAALLSNNIFGLREPYFGEELYNIQIPFFNLFARWDSCFYMEIAKQGYAIERFWAFFPLYPLILRYMSYPFSVFLYMDQALAIAGSILSHVFFTLSVIFFYKLTYHLYGNSKISYLSTLFLCFFPSSVFFSAVYTESLFIFLITASLYYSELKKWALSSLLAILSGFTRSVGFLMFLPLMYKALHESETEGRKSHVILALLPLLTYPAFMTYGYLETGNLFIHQHVEAKYWEVGIKNPIVSFINIGVYSGLGYQMLEAPFIFISVLSILQFFKNRENMKLLMTLGVIGKGDTDKAPYYLYAVPLLFIYLFFTDLRSFLRCALTLLPVFWYMGEISSEYETVKNLLIITCSSLLAIATALFVNWYHFL